MQLRKRTYGVRLGRAFLDPDGCPVPDRYAFDDFESQGLGMSQRRARRVARETGGKAVKIFLTLTAIALPTKGD